MKLHPSMLVCLMWIHMQNYWSCCRNFVLVVVQASDMLHSLPFQFLMLMHLCENDVNFMVMSDNRSNHTHHTAHNSLFRDFFSITKQLSPKKRTERNSRVHPIAMLDPIPVNNNKFCHSKSHSQINLRTHM